MDEPWPRQFLSHPLSAMNTYSDDPVGMVSNVGQPLQLTQGGDPVREGLECSRCPAEGELPALTAFEARCLCQGLQRSLPGEALNRREACRGGAPPRHASYHQPAPRPQLRVG